MESTKSVGDGACARCATIHYRTKVAGVMARWAAAIVFERAGKP
jgi:hypothetical protein